MKYIFLFLFLLTFKPLIAQELPKFIREKFEFCDSNLSDEQAIQLRKELNDLEDYLVMNGLLTDKSGTSYRAVYKQIVRENDLTFEIDTPFKLLDDLELPVCSSCCYKVLTTQQLSQLSQRHQLAAERISRSYEGNVTPSLVAQRVLENLTEDDFDLEYYSVLSLIWFYKISSPTSSLTVLLPTNNQTENASIKTINVILNENSQIVIDSNILTTEGAEQVIYEYLSTEPETKGIEFEPSRAASYESYLKTTKMFNTVYLKLKSEKGDIPKNIIFKKPL